MQILENLINFEKKIPKEVSNGVSRSYLLKLSNLAHLILKYSKHRCFDHIFNAFEKKNLQEKIMNHSEYRANTTSK